ncbi:MAG: type II secretion system protein [Planctomycetota bacterium]|nr:type II secretion system protein [Planctomycetota bacterium]
MMLDKSRVRNAFTLIEMVVVMALLGVVMLIATTMIMGLMYFSSSEIKLANRNMEVAALANLFRSDVRVASSAVITTNANKTTGLKLALLSGGQITYEVENGAFMRTSLQGKQRLMGVEDVSFQLLNDGLMVELNCLDKADFIRNRERVLSFRASLNGARK